MNSRICLKSHYGFRCPKLKLDFTLMKQVRNVASFHLTHVSKVAGDCDMLYWKHCKQTDNEASVIE